MMSKKPKFSQKLLMQSIENSLNETVKKKSLSRGTLKTSREKSNGASKLNANHVSKPLKNEQNKSI